MSGLSVHLPRVDIFSSFMQFPSTLSVNLVMALSTKQHKVVNVCVAAALRKRVNVVNTAILARVPLASPKRGNWFTTPSTTPVLPSANPLSVLLVNRARVVFAPLLANVSSPFLFCRARTVVWAFATASIAFKALLALFNGLTTPRA